MPTSSSRRQRLGDLLDERRLQLRMRWRDVARAAGISDETIRSVRKAQGGGGIRPLTAAGLEQALGLAPRAINRFLEGEIDTLEVAGTPPEHPGEDLARWVTEKMFARGKTPAEVADLAERMGWRGSRARARTDLTIEEWRVLADELDMSLWDVLFETGMVTRADAPGAAGLPPARREEGRPLPRRA